MVTDEASAGITAWKWALPHTEPISAKRSAICTPGVSIKIKVRADNSSSNNLRVATLLAR